MRGVKPRLTMLRSWVCSGGSSRTMFPSVSSVANLNLLGISRWELLENVSGSIMTVSASSYP
nr:hypothetical protein [uncultured bacterium]